MKKKTNLTAGVSEPEKVDEFMDNLKYPLSDLVKYLRELVLSTDKHIGEGIFWNAPTFYFTGTMKPFDPKEYKRYIVGFNLFQKDCVRLIFLRGASVNDSSGLLEGNYNDGRRIALFRSIEETKSKEKDLKKILKLLVKSVDK